LLMSNVAIIETLPSALVACTVSRNIEEFEGLIDAMEDSFGESWGDISFNDANAFLRKKDTASLQFMIVAVNAADEAMLDGISAIVQNGKARGLGVIVLSDAISPKALHKLMRSGADDFLPYPLPDSAFDEAIAQLEAKFAAKLAAQNSAATMAQMAAPIQKPIAPPPPPPQVIEPPKPAPVVQSPVQETRSSGGGRDGIILPIHGLSGGVGASTLAANLAHEMVLTYPDKKLRICLLDFDFQFGNIATYLDFTRQDKVMDFLNKLGRATNESFQSVLQETRDGLFVLTSPLEMVPLEIVTAAEMTHLLNLAKANFDYVLIDMPSTIVSWTESVLNEAFIYLAVVELDLRSAQNVLRLMRALKMESLPHEKIRFVLNRAPGFTDLSAKSRVKRMADSLDISIEVQLPDGGVHVSQSNDQGLPLATTAAKNAFRREIQKLAKSLIDNNGTAASGARVKR
jgi:pilus assembly protein CpaE